MRQKGIVAMNEHELQEIPREWICLDIELPEHLVDVPVANHIDDVSVYS